MVGVCEVEKRVSGRWWRGVISTGVGLTCGSLDLVARPAIRPPQKRLDASGPGNGAAEQRCLVGSQPVAERVEPSLLDVGIAVVGGKVNEDGQDVVVQVLEVRKHCLAVPPTVVVQVGQAVEQPRNLGGAGRGPADRPRRAGLPKLEDRLVGLGLAGTGVWVAGFAGLVGRVDQPGRVVREPPGEGVVRARIAELGEDSLAKCDERVSVR
jgi:hypothetical protein